jgi:hypothetical protein
MYCFSGATFRPGDGISGGLSAAAEVESGRQKYANRIRNKTEILFPDFIGEYLLYIN